MNSAGIARKRPLGHSAITLLAVAFAFLAVIAGINTGDLFVRAFLILAAGAGLAAANSVWHGRPNANKLVAIWSITTAVLGSAVFAYSRFYTLRQGDESIASNAILVALVAAFCAVYLERRPWQREIR